MYKFKKLIPNIVTITRILSLIGGFVLFLDNKIFLSLLLYIYGAASDAIDGYLARKLDAYSKFGQYLDAISDKLYFLSLIIILLINKKYLVIILLLMELVIVVINYLIIIRRRKSFTERVGKFKTTFLMITLILGIISIKINFFKYIYLVFLGLTIYFHIKTIIAYINQLNGNSKEIIIDFKGMNMKERIVFLLKEFMDYLK